MPLDRYVVGEYTEFKEWFFLQSHTASDLQETAFKKFVAVSHNLGYTTSTVVGPGG